MVTVLPCGIVKEEVFQFDIKADTSNCDLSAVNINEPSPQSFTYTLGSTGLIAQ